MQVSTTRASLGMALKLVTAPALEPITISLAKAWLRVDTSDEDTTIGALISAARHQVEQDTHRHLVTQTWDLACDRVPGDDALPLLVAPLQAVVSVTTYDEDDAATVLASTEYYVDTYREPGRLCLNAGVSWPTDLRAHAALIVRVRSGYAASALSISSLTRSSTTATATTSAAHGLVTGDVVTIAGAGQADYNSTVDVTVTNATAFTFTVSGSPATPATGTITATPTGVPAWATLALRLRLAALFEHREMSEADQRLYDYLVGPNKVHAVA